LNEHGGEAGVAIEEEGLQEEQAKRERKNPKLHEDPLEAVMRAQGARLLHFPRFRCRMKRPLHPLTLALTMTH
jgi:hypothetical protein